MENVLLVSSANANLAMAVNNASVYPWVANALQILTVHQKAAFVDIVVNRR